jgi:hypothetical protein
MRENWLILASAPENFGEKVNTYQVVLPIPRIYWLFLKRWTK